MKVGDLVTWKIGSGDIGVVVEDKCIVKGHACVWVKFITGSYSLVPKHLCKVDMLVLYGRSNASR